MNIFLYNHCGRKNKYIKSIHLTEPESIMVLREKVYQALKERIISGEYRPGEPLNEKEIIEELKVSRTPFREAINALHQEKLVQIFANRGIFVREITARDLADGFEIRCLLEPYAAKLACRSFSAEAAQKLADRIRAVLGGSYEDMLKEDDRYHREILNRIRNRHLADIMGNLYAQNQMQIAMYDNAMGDTVSETRKAAVEESLREHLDILKCMIRGDEEGAAQATTAHLMGAQQRAMALPEIR